MLTLCGDNEIEDDPSSTPEGCAEDTGRTIFCGLPEADDAEGSWRNAAAADLAVDFVQRFNRDETYFPEEEPVFAGCGAERSGIFGGYACGVPPRAVPLLEETVSVGLERSRTNLPKAPDVMMSNEVRVTEDVPDLEEVTSVVWLYG